MGGPYGSRAWPRVSGIHSHINAAMRNAADVRRKASPKPWVWASDPTAMGAAAEAILPML